MTPWQLRQAVRALRAGGVIAYPTEAVYGLGCDPWNPAAVHRLLALKQRPLAKGLILIAADLDQLAPFVTALDASARRTLQADASPPVTWLVPARVDTPVWLRGTHDTIAVRITRHPLAGALCTAAGHALVSTSANPGGYPPARSPLAVQRYFHGQLAMVLHGALGSARRPSAIRDLRSGQVVRPG